jgi:hypothetical protein
MTYKPKEYRIEEGYPGLYNVHEYYGDELVDVIMCNVSLDQARFFQAIPDLLAACEMRRGSFDGQHALREIATLLRAKGTRNSRSWARWLEEKADAEEAAIAKARGGALCYLEVTR